MPNPLINIGNVVNDGTGELGPRGWLQKINRLPNPDNTVNPLSGDYNGTYEQKITAAVADGVATGKKYCWITQPFNPSLVTFNTAIQMFREGGPPHMWDIKAYGAVSTTGIADDTAAWTAAIAGAAANNGYVYHPGGISGVSSLTFPPLNRTRLVGAGPTKSIIKDISGNGLIVSFSTHLSNEWYSGIEEMTIDGGGFAGPLLQISRASLFIMRNVAVSNCTGTCLQFTSLFDCFLENIFVSDYLGPIGTTAPAVIFDSVSSPSGEPFDHTEIVTLHIEGAVPNAFNPLQLLGNATNQVRYLRFYDLKVHTDPNAGTPATNLILFSANAVDNEVHGLKMASGNAAPQLLVNGHRNVFFGGQTNTGTALKATHAIKLVGNDNRVVGFNTQDTTYSTAAYSSSGARNKFSGIIYNTGGPVLENTGTETIFDGRPGSTNRGDTSITITPCVETEEQIFNTPLTVGRTCTVGNGTSGTQRWQGARFRIVRTAAATGAFVLNVRDPSSVVLRTLMPGEWVEIVYDDTNAWTVHAFGSIAHAASGSIVQTFSATPTFDASQASAFQMTLTANVTSVTISNGSLGQRVVLTMIQDGTGGRSVAGWVAAIKQAWVDTGNTLGKRSSIAFVWDGTNWNQDSAQTPYI